MSLLEQAKQQIERINASTENQEKSLRARSESIRTSAAKKVKSFEIALGALIVAERKEHPEVRGNADAILPHHFGALSLNTDVSATLSNLGDRIARAGRSKKDVPVILQYRDEHYGDFGSPGAMLTLVVVPRQSCRTPFLSRCEWTREPMHAFTAREEDVEHLSLALIGKSATIARGLLEEADPCTHAEVKCGENFCVRRTVIAAHGAGSGSLSSYAFHDTYDDRILKYDAGRVDRNIVVGWEELGVLMRGCGMMAYRNLDRLLHAAGVTDFGPSDSPLAASLSRLETARLLRNMDDL